MNLIQRIREWWDPVTGWTTEELRAVVALEVPEYTVLFNDESISVRNGADELLAYFQLDAGGTSGTLWLAAIAQPNIAAYIAVALEQYIDVYVDTEQMFVARRVDTEHRAAVGGEEKIH